MNKTPIEQQRDMQAAAPRVEITGRFDQYRSSYWAAMVAAFGARYPFRALTRSKCDLATNTIQRHAYSGVIGLMMESVTGFFALRTWKDMKSIFAETVAWELGKDPKDVTFADFRKSTNTMVQQTIHNYVKYNLRRAGVNAFFFVPLILAPIAKGLKLSEKSFFNPATWHFETGADLGLGVNAAYLYSDVISRKITQFEALQTAIDTKINHSQHAGDKMTGYDLLDIYERHAAKGIKLDSFQSERDTHGWNRSVAVFDRMADLMNQTYNNAPIREKADFNISKFIHLVGHGLIQPKEVEQSLAYVEVANRYGMKALTQVVAQVDAGKPLSVALQAYPVTLPEMPTDTPSHTMPEQQKLFTQSIESRLASTKPAPAAAYTDKVKTDSPFVGPLSV